MTWFDLAMLGVLALSALLAFFRGFVREVLGVGAWAGAIFLGFPAQRLQRDLAILWSEFPVRRARRI